MAVLTILSVDLKNRMVHFDLFTTPIDTLLDVDGEETKDPTLACYVVTKVPDEFHVPGGQWMNIMVDPEGVSLTRH